MVKNSNQSKVSVIIVSYNVKDFICLCLDSVLRAIKGLDAEVFVVDNNSSDESCLFIKKHFPQIILIENDKNNGFAKANNQAVAQASGDFIHFLNPDTVLPEDFYTKSIAFLLQHPKIGSIGPRIIDGLGSFSPDSKRSFPSLLISIYKIVGLSKIFRNSNKFNQYYAGHVQENEIAEVDILSGCCLLIRKSAMDQSGGTFDEAYFMHCEDIDLCYRLKLNGFQNYYFPETTIIHYKGESTRKLSYKQFAVFHNALSIFVKKYYPKRLGKIYINSIKIVLVLRHVITAFRYIFSLLKLFILDAITLTLITIGIKNFWFETIAEINLNGSSPFIETIPIFILIWLSCLFLNGAYDKPFSLFKAGRGMIIGTLVVLAWYSMFPLEYRYSRGVVLFSGMTNTVALLLLRIILSHLKLIPLVPRGKMNFKMAVVSAPNEYEASLPIIRSKFQYAAILGRISIRPYPTDTTALGSIKNLHYISKLFEINELLFNSVSLSYKDIIQQMEMNNNSSFFKIQCSKSNAFVGDHYGKNVTESQASYHSYAIIQPNAKRNKRLLDFFISLFFIFTYPIASFGVKNKKGFRHNIIQGLMGKLTWVGYGKDAMQLPILKKNAVPPYKIQEEFEPSINNKKMLAELYATQFSILDDLKFILMNFKYLGTQI